MSVSRPEPLLYGVTTRSAAGPSPTEGPQAGESGPDIAHLARILWCGKGWILALLAVAVALGATYALVVAVPQYSASAYVTLVNRQEQVLDFENVMSGVAADQTSINTEVEVLRSRDLTRRLAERLDLSGDPEFNLSLRPAPGAIRRLLTKVMSVAAPPDAGAGNPDGTTSRLRAAIKISSLRNTYVFRITATTGDPKKSVLLADTLADIYVSNQIELKSDATRRATVWLTDRVGELQADLERAEAAVKTFDAEADLISPDALDALGWRAKDLRERLRAASEASAAADLSAGRQAARKDGLRRSLAEIEDQIRRQSRDLVKLRQLTREAEAARAIYAYFLGRLKETSVQQGIQQADSRILSRAALPDGPSSPRVRYVMALSAVIGLAAGMALVLFRELNNNTIRTARRLEEVTGCTAMGQIPRMPAGRRRSVCEYLRSKPASAGAEALRNLRTSVMLSNIDTPPQVIMVTSSVPGEGKTTLSLALAQSFSGLGLRVLLIEGDLRRLVLGSRCRMTRTGAGLNSVLADRIPLQQAVAHVDLIGADVLFGERTSENVGDLLSSGNFPRMIAAARGHYDVILVDTPPVLVVPDAMSVAQSADALLLAVAWNRTDAGQVAEALRMLDAVNIRPTGAVLNRIDGRRMRQLGLGSQYGAGTVAGKGYYAN